LEEPEMVASANFYCNIITITFKESLKNYVTFLYRRTAGNQNKLFIVCRTAGPTYCSAPSNGKPFTPSMRIMWKDNRKADQLENLGFNWSQTPCQ
jgi:hypothetical protein